MDREALGRGRDREALERGMGRLSMDDADFVRDVRYGEGNYDRHSREPSRAAPDRNRDLGGRDGDWLLRDERLRREAEGRREDERRRGDDRRREDERGWDQQARDEFRPRRGPGGSAANAFAPRQVGTENLVDGQPFIQLRR
jgi:hypothetical protein